MPEGLFIPKWLLLPLLGIWVPFAPGLAHRTIDKAKAAAGIQSTVEQEASAGVTEAITAAFSAEDAIFAPGQQGKLDAMEARIITTVTQAVVQVCQHPFPGPPPPEPEPAPRPNG